MANFKKAAIVTEFRNSILRKCFSHERKYKIALRKESTSNYLFHFMKIVVQKRINSFSLLLFCNNSEKNKLLSPKKGST